MTPLFVPTRRAFLGLMLAGAFAPSILAAAGPVVVEVWKDRNCGCCHDWVAHLEANGFAVRSHDVGNDEMRARLGLPVKYASCHTARVGGYVVEGHVPAKDIQRLLRERPNALGLAAPGMPIGSPGMDGPAYGGRKDAYDVLLVRKDGGVSVFQSYR